MGNNTVVVFTARGANRILSENGSQAWRLNKNKAEACRYLVCTQNRHNGPWGEAEAEHSAAFLVGRIRDVVPSKEGGKAEGRWHIRISEYALIYIPRCWQGQRNPVRYDTLENLGIDLGKLHFQPMPNSQGLPPESTDNADTDAFAEDETVQPLTIAEAKAGLALGLGVPESAIEIQVRY